MPVPTDGVKPKIPVIPDFRVFFGEVWLHADRAVIEAQQTFDLLSQIHSENSDVVKLAGLSLHLAKAARDSADMVRTAVERWRSGELVRSVAKTGFGNL